MVKKQKGKIACAWIMFVLSAAAIGGFIGLLAGFNYLQPFMDALAKPEFVQILTFQGLSTLGWPAYLMLGGVYGGALFFLIGIILIIAKKSPRFLILPFLTLIDLAVAGIAFYYAWTLIPNAGDKTVPLILIGVIALLGLICLILSLVFPKNLKKAAAAAVAAPKEEGAAPAAEEAKPEEEPAPVKEEPKEEPAPVEPEPEPQPEPEPAPVAAAAVAAAPVEEEKPEEEPAPEEEKPAEEPVEEKPAEQKPAKKKVLLVKKEKKAENAAKPAPKAVKPAPKAAPAPKPAPAPKAAPVAAAAPAAAPKEAKVVGKYEIYPEAGFFKYRLKANNGEILIVSNGYKTKESARAGIDTLKKNVPLGNHKVVEDKNGYGQFRIWTANDTRLVAAGEIYPSVARAQSALNSVIKFYEAEKIVMLDDIPESEHREWPAELGEVNPLPNGKFEIFESEEKDKVQGRLIASNGEVLFTTSSYSSKAALLAGYDKVKARIDDGNITVARDKQNRYQFRVYSDNGMLLLMGETYPSKDGAVSAATSARNFIDQAKVVEAEAE